MAKDAALKDVSKTELAETYSKLKARTKAAQQAAAKESEMMIEDAITVASGGGLGYLMGQRYAEAAQAADADGLTGDERDAAVAEGGQIAGIDLDLLVGGAAAVAGITKLGGKMSNMVRRVGIGALTAYAARVGAQKGHEAAMKSDDE